MIKNISICALFIFSGLIYAGGQPDYIGNETYEYNLYDFRGIEGTASFDIEVKYSDEFSVVILADKSLQEKLIVEKRGDILYLGMKPLLFLNLKSPRAIITMPLLESVELSGASSIVAAGFKSGRNFVCDVSGASSLDIDIAAEDCFLEFSGASDGVFVLEVNNTNLDISGSSNIEIYGYGSDLRADLSGASSSDLSRFSIKNADIEISGSSDLKINMNGKLNIDASGASNLYYTGNVIMGEIELSGASTIKEE